MKTIMEAASYNLRGIMNKSVHLTQVDEHKELSMLRIQLRIVTALLLATISFSLLDPAVYIMTIDSSMYSKIGRALHNPLALAACFVACSVSLMPYMLVQMFFPFYEKKRQCAKLACFGLFAAGALWLFLGWYIWDWDVQTVSAVFCRLGVGAVLFSLTIALSLNAELLQKLFREEACD